MAESVPRRRRPATTTVTAATTPRPNAGTRVTQLKPRELKRLTRNEEAMPTARPATPAPVVVPEVTPEVRSAAEGWFAAYQRGDATWLAGWSATPFVANGQVTARDAKALKAMYKQLLDEAGVRKLSGKTEVLTPAGMRGRLHGLPPGGEEHDMLFAVGKAGPDEFILLLKLSNQGWRVAGLAR